MLRNRHLPRQRAARRGLAFETLELRRLLATIEWVNFGSDGFENLGSNELAGRLAALKAIDDWEQVIQSFNYADGPDVYQLTFNINPPADADNPSGGSGGGLPTMIDAQGKPRGGTVSLPAFGIGSTPWDFSPLDDSEFDDPKTPFASFGDTRSAIDFYTIALHEIGHALGMTGSYDCQGSAGSEDCLATHEHLTGPLHDDPLQANPVNMLYNFVVGGEVIATFTNAGDGTANPDSVDDMRPAHVYEGHENDPPGVVAHPYDLMNDGRSFLGQGGSLTEGRIFQRRLISDINATILAEAYGYTVNMPSQINNMFAVVDWVDDVLHVRGLEDQDDQIRIDMVGGDIRVEVNGNVELFDPNGPGGFNRIQIDGRGGMDTVIVETLAGAGLDDDVRVYADDPGDSLLLDATEDPADVVWDIYGNFVQRADWDYQVLTYTPYTGFFAGPGDNLVRMHNTSSNRSYQFIGGAGNDQLHLLNLDGHYAAISMNGNGGYDQLLFSDADELSPRTYSVEGQWVYRDGPGGSQQVAVLQQGVELTTIQAGTGADEIHVRETLPGTATVIQTGGTVGGDDVIVLDPPPPPSGPNRVHVGDGDMSNIQGGVYVVGGEAVAELHIDDRPSDLGGLQIEGNAGSGAEHSIYEFLYQNSKTPAPVYYFGMEDFQLWGGAGADTVTVYGTQADTPVTVRTGDGDDTIWLGGNNAAGPRDLDVLDAFVSVHGENGDDLVFLMDGADNQLRSYQFHPDSVQRNGSFGGLEYGGVELLYLDGGTGLSANYDLYAASAEWVILNGNGGNDTFRIRSGDFQRFSLLGGTHVTNDRVFIQDLPHAVYRPTVPGSGEIRIAESLVDFYGIEDVLAQNLDELQFVTPNQTDILQLAQAGLNWQELTGTSDGVPLTDLRLQSVERLSVDMAENDTGGGNDRLQVELNDVSGLGIEELQVNGGTGSNVVQVVAGQLRLDADVDGSGLHTSVTVSGASTSVQFFTAQHLAFLSIRDHAEVELQQGAGFALQVEQLQMGGPTPAGTLDIQDNGLVVHYAGTSPLGRLEGHIEHARSSNAPAWWTGEGITSGLADLPSDQLVAEEADEYFAGLGGEFHGATLGAGDTAVLIELRQPGEAAARNAAGSGVGVRGRRSGVGGRGSGKTLGFV